MEDEITVQPGETIIGVIASRLVLELRGRSDSELDVPIQAFGDCFIMLVGPHTPPWEAAFCWCQPTITATGVFHKSIAH